MTAPRRIPNDWYDDVIPDNAVIDPTAMLVSSYSFRHFRSQRHDALRIGHAALLGMCVMDVGEHGRIEIGDYAMVVDCAIFCDAEIRIGAHAMIAWNAVIMDSLRGMDPTQAPAPRPVCLQDNTWIGFRACVMPGVTVGEGSIVGAGAVVTHDVPPYTIVAGNPARVVRKLPQAPG